MTLARGRLLRPASTDDATPVARSPLGLRGGRRIPREVLAAHERAESVVLGAEHRGRAILELAERGAASIRERAVEQGRAEGAAEVLSSAVVARLREAQGDEAAVDRLVELARLLAERLLGHELRQSPGEIAHLARQTVAEARGARTMVVSANPDDAGVLGAVLDELDAERRVHRIVPDASLGRGDLRLETDVGTLDARLGSSLERLAARLREALRR